MSPTVKQILLSTAQVVMTVGAKVWLTSRALKSRHLQRIFIMPKACSMMVRALEPPLQWLSIQSDDGASLGASPAVALHTE
ncbi:hypothetical protein ABVT39_024691 [Epinephelus coioides]